MSISHAERKAVIVRRDRQSESRRAAEERRRREHILGEYKLAKEYGTQAAYMAWHRRVVDLLKETGPIRYGTKIYMYDFAGDFKVGRASK